jgi:hypothetical protein
VGFVRFPTVIGLVLAGLAGLALASPRPGHATAQKPVRATPNDELSGFAGGGFFGWAQNSRRRPNHYNLFLRSPAGKVRVNRPGTTSFSGGIDGTTVVYAELRRRRERLVLYDATVRSYTELPVTNRGETAMRPTISGEWILYTKGRRHKRTSVRLYNRATSEARQLGSDSPGRHRYVYSGQVAGNWAVWGEVQPRRQSVFLTNITSGKTVKIARRRGVKFQYVPAVTPNGTVFFVRSRPCLRRCPRLNTPAAVFQIVEQRLGRRQRVVTTFRKGRDANYLYAALEGNRTKVLYSRFRWLRGGDQSYGDIFTFKGST